MAKTLKIPSDRLPKSPVAGDCLDEDRILDSESQIIASRNDFSQGLRSIELNEKLESLRLMVLENMDTIFSEMDISDPGLVTHIGRTKQETRTSWSEIDKLVAHLIMKWSSIHSGAPDDPNKLRVMMEGNIDQAKAEVASCLGFGDYDKMNECIQMGKDSEKRIDLN